ncbi:hypothetical protein [Duffyella gerundensis]|uniref:hypothetical protein n=1 Tax=Duffyella gerundensis TaxID=1619313 RepID=UPI0016546FE4|nr:hypothetical protein [Duffyella gerundensis]
MHAPGASAQWQRMQFPRAISTLKRFHLVNKRKSWQEKGGLSGIACFDYNIHKYNIGIGIGIGIGHLAYTASA